VKRLFDIFFSLIGLLLLFPLFIAVAILIKIDSPGPVFFKQQRMGKNLVPFLIYKFRTMARDASQKGLGITIGGDTRVTRMGRLLRKSKIDEFPQLINVLKGDMSIVGPRPELETYVELYKNDYKDILCVRPGITDISSVTFRDEESILKDKNDPENYYRYVVLPAKINLSREYIERSSFFYDLKLIFVTFYRLFHRNTSEIPIDGYAQKNSARTVMDKSKDDPGITH